MVGMPKVINSKVDLKNLKGMVGTAITREEYLDAISKIENSAWISLPIVEGSETDQVKIRYCGELEKGSVLRDGTVVEEIEVINDEEKDTPEFQLLTLSNVVDGEQLQLRKVVSRMTRLGLTDEELEELKEGLE